MHIILGQNKENKRLYMLKISVRERLALLICHVCFIKIPFNMFRPYLSLTERFKNALVRMTFLNVTVPRRKGATVESPATPPSPHWAPGSTVGLEAVGVLRARRSGTGRTLHIRWPLCFKRTVCPVRVCTPFSPCLSRPCEFPA